MVADAGPGTRVRAADTAGGRFAAASVRRPRLVIAPSANGLRDAFYAGTAGPLKCTLGGWSRVRPAQGVLAEEVLPFPEVLGGASPGATSGC